MAGRALLSELPQGIPVSTQGCEPLIYAELIFLLRVGWPPPKLLGHFLCLDLSVLSLTCSDTASPCAGPSFLISPCPVGYSPSSSSENPLQRGPHLLLRIPTCLAYLRASSRFNSVNTFVKTTDNKWFLTFVSFSDTESRKLCKKMKVDLSPKDKKVELFHYQ